MTKKKILQITVVTLFAALALVTSLFLNGDNSQAINFTFASDGASDCTDQTFGNSCIDNSGKPRCTSDYQESCGPNGQTRSVTCGPNGEFIAGECTGTPTPAQQNGDDTSESPQCPVATIWDGSTCKGTATGTDDETVDQAPVEGGGDIVADKAAKPNDAKTRAGANQQTDAPDTIPVASTDPDIGNESAETSLARDACRAFLVEQGSNALLINPPVISDGTTTSQTPSVPDQSICNTTDPNSALLDYCNTLDDLEKVSCEEIAEALTLSIVSGDTEENEDTPTVNQAEITCARLITSMNQSCQTGSSYTGITLNYSYYNPNGSVACNYGYNGRSNNTTIPLTGVVTLTSNETSFIDRVCTSENVSATAQSSVDVSVELNSGNVGDDSSIINNEKQNSFNFIPKVSAQEAPPTPEIISLKDIEAGTYTFIVEGYSVPEVTIYSDSVSVNFYIDSNSNGKKDSGEELDIETLQVSISKTKEARSYTLERGWNSVGFPFVNETISTASNLITQLARRGVLIEQISTYEDDAFVHFVSRVGTDGKLVNYGPDFDIVPGKGYFLYSPYGGEAFLSGNVFTESVPLNLQKGWNLTSIQSEQSYTATSLLKSCSLANLSCTQLSRYQNGLYDSVVEQDGFYFGNDFGIKDSKGYFIKVNGESGKYTP